MFPKFNPVGESAVLLEIDEELTPAINRRVHALDSYMQANSLRGVREWVPAYSSMLVIFDPLLVEISKVQSWLKDCLENVLDNEAQKAKKVVIPVHYGGENGPDLAYVAFYNHLSPGEVVRRHTAQTYHVGMMGFTPGFAYLLGLDSSLETPRLKSPRTLVPAGSVGIAGGQTGIYPLESPGGWQLIGRTDMTLFDPDQSPFFLLAPGDEVQFHAVNTGAFL
ncbi:MAG: 5-oxoprolinase subunit PxpB [Brevefilum sp.]|nr:5-oxoprolinase subunit PxpB [Brevefilum sp.]MDT8381442.1 5-oxoprolinase subunit PxpB [Brevefilum sp.]MDW7753692.1 5-oxoprolinase subunit PxpB [Brevefilum sp.]